MEDMQDYLKELNEEQLAAVEHEGTPLLIMAGAGSGKTKTLTYKAAHLVHGGKARPNEILLVTFTNKAAKEMKERVEKVTGERLGSVGTFHSICARILRRSGQEIGIVPDFVIYDDGDQQDLVKDIMNNLNLDPKRYKPRSIMSTISSAKQEMLTAGEYQGIARGQFQEVASQVYKQYEQMLKKYSALDFDDLLFTTVKLLKESPSTLLRYQEMFPYIFVDEYQDTNMVQYNMAKMLSDLRKQITVVGDASQSIYKWRGADYRNMEKLKKDYPDLTEIHLSRNYRSTQNILDAATQVIKNNRSHAVLSLWTDAGAGEKIELLENYSGGEEAKRVAEEIVSLHDSGRAWSEIAVLYRTNAQSRAFEESFIRNGIPYVLVGGTKFYERKEVKDVLSYIRVMLNPNDGVSYKRAEKLGKRRLETILTMRESFDINGKSAEQILEKVLSVTKYMDKYDPEIEEDLSRIENVKELQAVASEFEDLSAFLENVALVQAEYYEGEKSSNQRESITLMTLHAAKGLEFPVVFMVGLEEGLFPHSRSLMDNEEMEEERRLMYVGVTRAKEKLYLSYARSRSFWGASGPQMKSRFIDEIDGQLIRQPENSESRKAGGSESQNLGKSEKDFWQEHGANFKTKKSGVRIDSLGDDTLDDFLSGNMSVEELLSR